MEQVRDGTCPIIPVRLADYLGRVTPTAHAQVQTGAWNVGSTSGEDLSQWAGSERQREAVAEVARLSARYWQLMRGSSDATAQCGEALSRARRSILEAETSCFLFWGDSWIPHLHARTHDASLALDEAELALTPTTPADPTGLGPGGLAE
jgi:4-alpha-glucanotransferase